VRLSNIQRAQVSKMASIKMEFPNVLVIDQLERVRAEMHKELPGLLQKAVSESFQGVVDASGMWGKNINGGELSPGPWTIFKQDVGVYKVIHNQGYMNISLSVSPIVNPCTIQVSENSPNYFVVNTSVEGKPVDLPFAFTMIKVVSPLAPPSASKYQALPSFVPNVEPMPISQAPIEEAVPAAALLDLLAPLSSSEEKAYSPPVDNSDALFPNPERIAQPLTE